MEADDLSPGGEGRNNFFFVSKSHGLADHLPPPPADIPPDASPSGLGFNVDDSSYLYGDLFYIVSYMRPSPERSTTGIDRLPSGT